MSKAPHPKPHPVKLEEKLGMAPFVAGAARIYIVVTIFICLNIFQDGFGCLFVCMCEYLSSTISKVTLWVWSTVQIVPEGPRWARTDNGTQCPQKGQKGRQGPITIDHHDTATTTIDH